MYCPDQVFPVALLSKIINQNVSTHLSGKEAGLSNHLQLRNLLLLVDMNMAVLGCLRSPGRDDGCAPATFMGNLEIHISTANDLFGNRIHQNFSLDG